MGLAKRTIADAIDPRSGVRTRPQETWNPGTSNYSYLETDRLVDNTVYQFRTEVIGRRKDDGKIIKKTYTRNRIFNLNEFSPAANRNVTGSSPAIPYSYRQFSRYPNSWVAPENACDDFGY
jgi:hypothetical protein